MQMGWYSWWNEAKEHHSGQKQYGDESDYRELQAQRSQGTIVILTNWDNACTETRSVSQSPPPECSEPERTAFPTGSNRWVWARRPKRWGRSLSQIAGDTFETSWRYKHHSWRMSSSAPTITGEKLLQSEPMSPTKLRSEGKEKICDIRKHEAKLDDR